MCYGLLSGHYLITRDMLGPMDILPENNNHVSDTHLLLIARIWMATITVNLQDVL